MRVAIFGGTFNPVHTEHVGIVKAAIDELGLDLVYVVPTAETPGKGGVMCASPEERLEMCRLAFSGIGKAEVSDEEIRSGGVSYSYITCERFAREHSSDERFLILGCDMLRDFPSWRFPERILSCVTIAACAREDAEELAGAAEDFEALYGKGRLVTFSYVGRKVSSTRCRVLACAGESLSGCVPEAVEGYIRGNGVYSLLDFSEVRSWLKPSRWEHTLRVAYLTCENCRRIGWDERDALTAAMLHDCAKYLAPDSPLLERFVPPAGVPAPVMHQFTGAYVAKTHFGVTDEKILSAIRYHCSARPDMGREEILLYLCDMLEEGRDFPGVDDLRAVFAIDLVECMYIALKHQTEYLRETGEPVYELTEKAYEYLKENR